MTDQQIIELWLKCCEEGHNMTAWHETDPAVVRDFANKILEVVLENQMNTHAMDVKDFNKKFGLMIHDKPTHLTTRKLRERIEFMYEELREFEDSAQAVDTVVNGEAVYQDMEGMADALVDLVYVAIGTAVMMGLPWQQLWDDVHRANMAKVLGATKRNHRVDLMKPEGWVGPKTSEILTQAGYTGDNIEERKDDPA